MRYLKVLALVVLFFLSMVFFIQNTPELSKEVTLSIELFSYKFMSQPLPYYLLILIAFAAGSVLCLLYFMADKIRLSVSSAPAVPEWQTSSRKLILCAICPSMRGTILRRRKRREGF